MGHRLCWAVLCLGTLMEQATPVSELPAQDPSCFAREGHPAQAGAPRGVGVRGQVRTAIRPARPLPQAVCPLSPAPWDV